MKALVLDHQERNDPLMRRLFEHWQAELDEARRENDDSNLSPEKTAFKRGRIAQLKALLHLGKEPDLSDK